MTPEPPAHDLGELAKRIDPRYVTEFKHLSDFDCVFDALPELIAVVKAAHEVRQADRALWARYTFDEQTKAPTGKVYEDGTPHSVEEQARRLEAHSDAGEALDAALRPFYGGGASG